LTILFLFFGASCIALGIFAAVSRSDAGMLCVSAFGLVFIGIGVWWYVSNKRQRDLRVLVFPQGLSYTNRGQTEIIRWDEVDTVWQDITRNTDTGVTTHVYTVERSDGARFTFKDTLVDVGELGHTIQQESTRCILPRVIEAYNAGETIPFGKISISKDGITKGKETLPWDQIEGVRLSQGVISIEKEGKWLKWSSFRASETPNIFVLAAVVDQVVGINKEK